MEKCRICLKEANSEMVSIFSQTCYNDEKLSLAEMLNYTAGLSVSFNWH